MNWRVAMIIASRISRGMTFETSQRAVRAFEPFPGEPGPAFAIFDKTTGAVEAAFYDAFDAADAMLRNSRGTR